MLKFSYIKNYLQLTVEGYYDENATLINVSGLPDDFPTTFDLGIPFVWYNRTNNYTPKDDESKEFILVVGRPSPNTLQILRAQQETLATPKALTNKLYVLELVISQKMLYMVAGLFAIPVTVTHVETDRVFAPRRSQVILAIELQMKLPVVYTQDEISVVPE